MLVRSRTLALMLSIAVLSTPVVACDGDGGNGEEPTATVLVTAPLASPTVPSGLNIRDEALDVQPGLSEYLLSSGGVMEEGDVLYTDLTGSGTEEAVVPVSSGGEGGDIAVFVFGYEDEEIVELLRVEPQETSIVASIEDGQLVTTEGIFAPGDPINFPSQLLHRYYTWDGTNLVLDREEQESAR